MDLDGASHVGESGVLAGAAGLTSFPAVVFAVDQVIAGTEGDEMGVVGGGGDGHRAGTADVGVAHLIGELLQLVGAEVVVVPEHMVVGRTGGALNTGVTAQVEVELGRVGDPHVHGGARGDVEGLPDLVLLVHGEETGVVAFLHGDEGDSGLVAALQHHAGLSDGPQLALQDVQELAFADTVAVEDDAGGLEASVAVELDEQLAHHVGQVGDGFVAVLLHSDGSGVSGGVGVHGPDDGGDGGFAGIPGRGVGDVGAQEDDGLAEDPWTDVGQENGVDSSEFDVHFQAQIGKSLRGSFDHVLGLHALGGDAEHGVADALHFG